MEPFAVLDSVVKVTAGSQVGTGFYYGPHLRHDGKVVIGIITAKHVLESTSTPSIFDSSGKPVELISTWLSPRYDVAVAWVVADDVLAIPYRAVPAIPYRAVGRVADRSPLELVGESVIVAGYPLGLAGGDPDAPDANRPLVFKACYNSLCDPGRFRLTGGGLTKGCSGGPVFTLTGGLESHRSCTLYGLVSQAPDEIATLQRQSLAKMISRDSEALLMLLASLPCLAVDCVDVHIINLCYDAARQSLGTQPRQ